MLQRLTSPAPSLPTLFLSSFSFLSLTHHSPSLSCSLPPQLSLLSDAGATPLILPAAAWWRTVTDRVALPLYPAVLKRWYIHLHGLITTWHVPHLQQTLSWQQPTKRSVGCALITKWNKSNSTSKRTIWAKIHTSDYINFHIFGDTTWDQRWHLAAQRQQRSNIKLGPDLNQTWCRSQISLPIIFIFVCTRKQS